MVLGARDISSMAAAILRIHAVLINYAVPKEELKANAAARRNVRKRKTPAVAATQPGELTEAERALVDQARIDDPDAFKALDALRRDLATSEMRRLADEVKHRRREALKHAKHQTANSRAELEEMVNTFYNQLVQKDRAKREKRQKRAGK